MPRAAIGPPPGMRTSTSADVGQLVRGGENRLIGVLDGRRELEGRLGAHDARENLANTLVVLGDQHADAGRGLHTPRLTLAELEQKRRSQVKPMLR